MSGPCRSQRRLQPTNAAHSHKHVQATALLAAGVILVLWDPAVAAALQTNKDKVYASAWLQDNAVRIEVFNRNAVLQKGIMPPWKADARFDGKFANERKIPAAEKEILLRWIAEGMKRGEPAEDPKDTFARSTLAATGPASLKTPCVPGRINEATSRIAASNTGRSGNSDGPATYDRLVGTKSVMRASPHHSFGRS